MPTSTQGQLRIRRRFPKKRCVLPGRCGHRPLRKVGGFPRSFRADKKIPRRVGRGQGCGIDGACRPGYEVRSHWISCTLSIAWGEGESPSKRVGRKKYSDWPCLHALFAEEKLRLRAKRAHVLQRLRVFDGRVERERADFPQQLYGSILRGLPGGLLRERSAAMSWAKSLTPPSRSWTWAISSA